MFTGKPAERRKTIRRTLIPCPDAGGGHALQPSPRGGIAIAHGGGAMLPQFETHRRVVAWIAKRPHNGETADLIDKVCRCQRYWAARGVVLTRLPDMDEECTYGKALCFLVEGERDCVQSFSLREKDLVRVREDYTSPESGGGKAHERDAHPYRKHSGKGRSRSRRSYSTDNSGKPFLKTPV